MSREYTVEEMQEMFLDQLKVIERDCISGVKRGRYSWEEAVNLAIFSMLAIFDGESVPFPATDIVPNPHPSDKQYCIDNKENYFPEGVNIVDGTLHHKWANKK